MKTFPRIEQLPPYVFHTTNIEKAQARARGVDVIDFGMGNPDQPTPSHIVETLLEAAKQPEAHRYSATNGILRLRRAICDWYQRRYDVQLCPETEATVTIGSKEGLAHLALAISGPGDMVMVPDPCYPIHSYGFIIAGAKVLALPMQNEYHLLELIEKALIDTTPKPSILVLNFPANPSTQCVELDFFEHVVRLAKQHHVWVIHDLAYADIVFDGYQAPSILQVSGAKDVACETFSLSKSYNMPGWRVGFLCGNPTLVGALKHIKSYLDYGTFTPIQVAASAALEGDEACVEEIVQRYQRRRDVLCTGLKQIGWAVTPPKATMFVWAPIPTHYQHMGSMAFTSYLLKEANVAVAPGIGFGKHGDGFVRFGLIESCERTNQAILNLKALFRRDGLLANDE